MTDTMKDISYWTGRIPAYMSLEEGKAWAIQRIRVKRMVGRLRRVVKGNAWNSNGTGGGVHESVRAHVTGVFRIHRNRI